MNKLKETFKTVKEKFKGMSKRLKIVTVVAGVALIASLIFLRMYINNNKYGILFSSLDPADGKVITEKLQEKKVDTKIKGTSILVPKEQVDELRLELAPSLSNGSKGYELLDEGSSFGMTDEEFKIKKQRVLQGEVEKTIKSFPQVENARVHLTPAQDSVFVKDSKPGKASIYIQLKPNENLSKEQVKSIVSLVAGASTNIPKENIEVIDDNMNLLTEGLFDDTAEGAVSSVSLEKQKQEEKKFKTQLESSVLELLEPVLGKGRVKVQVSPELDFDAKQKDEVVVDPNKVIISESTTKEYSGPGGNKTTQSPVDNNMNNTITNNNGDNNSSTKEDQKINYEVGKTQTKTITAPGSIRRLTASVIIDGMLDENSIENIKSAVGGAIGFNQQRGDQISVLGMNFDTASKDSAKEQFDALKAQEEKEQKMALYRNIGLGVLGLIAFILILIAIIKKRKKKNKNKREEVEEIGNLDVVVGENIEPKETVTFKPIDFEVKDEKTHIENEIKRYAKEKPEQVVDIIKSWLTDDER